MGAPRWREPPTLPPMMDAFTLITGLASLFGFAVQIFDIFPAHAKGRQAIWMLLLGAFLGGLLATTNWQGMELSLVWDGFTLSMTALAALVVFFALAAAFTADTRRRRGFYIVGGIAALAFTIATSVGALVGTVTDSKLLKQNVVNEQELVWLIDRANDRGDQERALHHIESLLDRLDEDNEQRATWKARRDELRAAMKRRD